MFLIFMLANLLMFNFTILLVELNADFQTGLLNVKLLGPNKCKAGDTILFQNNSAQLRHGDILELLEKQYLYRVEFNPIPSYPNHTSRGNSNSEMVGKQTTLNDFLGKRKPDETVGGSKECKKPKMEHTWEEIDGGKLIMFTTEGVQSKSKVY